MEWLMLASGSNMANVGPQGQEGSGGDRKSRTFMMGSWPLTPATSFCFLMSTTRSLPL